MNDLITTTKQLPDTLPELTKFVLVGREKLASVRAEIRAIQKVGLAKEVLEQKKAEAQEIAELVTLSEVQIGKMLKAIPKAKGGAPFHSTPDTFVDSKPHTKAETLQELHIPQKTAERFQQMAEHEDIVHKAIEEARENDDVISRNAVMQKISEAKKPHVTNNSGDNEWYTPAEYIEAAREVMGSIDLDPASNEYANETVKASTYYTEETNGLDKEWFGNIWMNPPYSTALIKEFAEKLSNSTFKQAIVLVNNATDTAWFKLLIQQAKAVVFTTGRIRFEKRNGSKGAPLQGQAFIYYGNNAEKFLEVFEAFGWGATV